MHVKRCLPRSGEGQVQTLLCNQCSGTWTGYSQASIRSSITNSQNRVIFLHTELAAQVEWGGKAKRLHCWHQQMCRNGGVWLVT